MAAERWENILTRVAELGRASVRAGVVGPAARETHQGTDLTNAEIGLIQELGAPSIGLPERSFVRKTLQDPAFRKEYVTLLSRITQAVILGKMDRNRALGLLGAFAASRIKATIVEDKVRPVDSPATVAAKGSSTVLVDSGQLAAAVGWEIEK